MAGKRSDLGFNEFTTLTLATAPIGTEVSPYVCGDLPPGSAASSAMRPDAPAS
jgi:hypothetical protein